MFDVIILNPLTNLLIGLYFLLWENMGLAIIVFTILIRLLLLPLNIQQIKTQRKIAKLQPKLLELQSKKDPNKLTLDDINLVKETTVGFFGGCLFLILQIPVFWALNVLIHDILSVNSDPNKGGDFFNNRIYFDFLKRDHSYIFNTNFLGIDLTLIPSQLDFNQFSTVIIIVLSLVFLSQYFSSLLMLRMQDLSAVFNKNKKKKKIKSKEEQEREEMIEMQKKTMRFQMLYLIPGMVVFGAYYFSIALSLYWIVQNILGIIQIVVQYSYTKGRIDYDKMQEILGYKLIKNLWQKKN